ncbi:bifunctional DNA-formamidopyrimidine glycosylase/DNA-(apurinic or apyrimidinic site) lyase [Methylomagnum sp.]
MPELPEVETTRRGIAPHILGASIAGLVVRQPRLRWPVPGDLPGKLAGQSIQAVRRRGKYLLLDTGTGTLIFHLGMSGSLRLTDPNHPPRKHDHLDLVFGNGLCLRFHDPRRFGCLLWTEAEPESHPLLANLGPEPLSADFTGHYLHERAGERHLAVKLFIMDSHIVVGVGNIYANESLFRAGIAPARPAGRVSLARYEKLVESIREVLEASIEQGGTTLRDFVNESGNPGYFRQTLQVYERADEPCRHCGTALRQGRLGQRATYWCGKCQR